MSSSTFDPSNIQKYYGKSFFTRSGSIYTITVDGKFSGRPSIEGGHVELIASVPAQYLSELDRLQSLPVSLESKTMYDLVIKNLGLEVQKGLALVVSLTEQSMLDKMTLGIITSNLTEIK